MSPGRKVNICHRTASDSNPYTFITVSVNSTKKLAGHLAHRNLPSRWLHGRRDYISGLDGVIRSKADCPNGGDPPSRPDFQKPDTTLPEVTLPVMTTPDVTLPRIHVRNRVRPDTRLPEVTVPNPDGPDLHFPSVVFPSVTRPDQIGPGRLGPFQTRPWVIPKAWALRLLRALGYCRVANPAGLDAPAC